MDERLKDGAAELVARHGKKAVQFLVDRLVVAVRAQDEPEILALDRQIRQVDRLLEEASQRQRFAPTGIAA